MIGMTWEMRDNPPLTELILTARKCGIKPLYHQFAVEERCR
jgi:hypothetical protein